MLDENEERISKRGGGRDRNFHCTIKEFGGQRKRERCHRQPRWLNEYTRVADLGCAARVVDGDPGNGMVAGVICITSRRERGIPFAEMVDGMNFRCQYCHRDFAFETASYAYIHSKIFVHLNECEGARVLSKHERAIVVAKTTDAVFGYPGPQSELESIAPGKR